MKARQCPSPHQTASQGCRWPLLAQKGPAVDQMLCVAFLKFFIIFFTRASHFHFVPGLTNYVAGPAALRTWPFSRNPKVVTGCELGGEQALIGWDEAWSPPRGGNDF